MRVKHQEEENSKKKLKKTNRPVLSWIIGGPICWGTKFVGVNGVDKGFAWFMFGGGKEREPFCPTLCGSWS